MQKFYRDKSKLFECNISVDGAKLNETKARLVLEFPNNRNLLFHGKINESGRCEIIIPPLKEIDESTGMAILEVIAESTYFESWRDDFKLETNKKVTVEMVNEKNVIEEKKVTPHVQIITKTDEKPIQQEKSQVNIVSEFKNFATNKNFSISELVKNKEQYKKTLLEFKRHMQISKDETIKLHEQIVSQYINKLLQ